MLQLHKIAASDTQIGPRSYSELALRSQVLHSTTDMCCVGEKYADYSWGDP